MERHLPDRLHEIRATKGLEIDDQADLEALLSFTRNDILDACARVSRGLSSDIEEEHEIVEQCLEELEMLVESHLISEATKEECEELLYV